MPCWTCYLKTSIDRGDLAKRPTSGIEAPFRGELVLPRAGGRSMPSERKSFNLEPPCNDSPQKSSNSPVVTFRARDLHGHFLYSNHFLNDREVMKRSKLKRPDRCSVPPFAGQLKSHSICLTHLTIVISERAGQ
jgi:hypothetical protein